jgi:hypothetical protein
VTQVFIDVGAASPEGAAPEAAAADGGAPVDPNAIRALEHLAEAGVTVFLVTAGGSVPAPELRAAANGVVEAIPTPVIEHSWYLTSDIERCVGSSARLVTVFIGGTPPSGSIRRCDKVARDVQAAAMEILASEAMPAQTS